jgi:CheY-like chemotaxis protein
VQLNQVSQEAVELLAYPLRVDNVEVRLDLAPDLPVLWADPHQLHQVIVNLITNAHQAMREVPPPRRLTLTTRSDPAQGRVALTVADTGPGISAEIRSRIFEPFFTTKPPGQGTGLGLSLCQGIVEGHVGSIRVESEPGRGAIFRIELPVEATPVTVPEAPAAEALPPLRGKAILVVDDEPEVAGVLADLLAADGHHVGTVANGARALDKIQEGAYDLILSDMRMPELDGPGLYRELERRYPDLRRRVIFITGDTLGQETLEFLGQTGAPSLNKPFVLEEVRRVVQRALRAEREGRTRDDARASGESAGGGRRGREPGSPSRTSR